MAGNLEGNNCISTLTICIIGAGGYIGVNLCDHILRHTHHHILAIDTNTTMLDELLNENPCWKDRMDTYWMDMSLNPELIIPTSDLVFNLALSHNKTETYTRNPLVTIQKDLDNALKVARWCSKHKKRLIHLSGYDVYGDTIEGYVPKDSPLRQGPLLEIEVTTVDSAVSLSHYGSYAVAEQLIDRMIYVEGAKQNLPFTIVKPYHWIGPKLFAQRQPEASIKGGKGKSEKEFVYINDAIKALLLIMENPVKFNGKTVHIGKPHSEVNAWLLNSMMTKAYEEMSTDAMVMEQASWRTITTMEEVVALVCGNGALIENHFRCHHRSTEDSFFT